MAREVSSPIMPLGALARGRAFSSAEWGAWSVAMASMVPSFRPAMMPLMSLAVRRGGLIRASAPRVRISSSVRAVSYTHLAMKEDIARFVTIQ